MGWLYLVNISLSSIIMCDSKLVLCCLFTLVLDMDREINFTRKNIPYMFQFFYFLLSWVYDFVFCKLLIGLEYDLETHLLESDYFVHPDNIVLSVLSGPLYFQFVGTSNSPLGKFSVFIFRSLFTWRLRMCLNR